MPVKRSATGPSNHHKIPHTAVLINRAYNHILIWRENETRHVWVGWLYVEA